MRLTPRSLRGRLLLVILAALALAQGVSLWLFAGERSLALQTALGQEAAARAANVALLLETADAAQADAILMAADSPLVRFSLDPRPDVEKLDRDGAYIAALISTQMGRAPGRDVRAATRTRRIPVRSLAGAANDMERMHRAMGRPPVSAVEMRISIRLAPGNWLNVLTRFHRPPMQRAFASVATFAVSAVAIALVLWLALGRLTGPLGVLAETAGRFGRGEDTATLAPGGPDELRRLTDAFNDMQNRIRRFVGDRTRLLAALGHDLRSPLTALRVRAEMVEDDETRDRMIASIEEMQAMVEATLTFARGMAAGEPAEAVDLERYVGALASEMAEAGEDVVLSPPATPLAARLRPAATRRALRNLIGNATRYGERARIGLSTGVHGAEIVIDDDGPGIPEADLGRVFEPFVRLESSRSRDTGGTGLGLSIARSILLAQGGDITLENRPGGGLRATVTLPGDVKA